ncbi:unnamed protein product, partial [Phaeothamnion confervicola]
AAGFGFNGGEALAWEEAVRVAMEEEEAAGGGAFGVAGAGAPAVARERRVLERVLATGLVPEDDIGACVEAVLAPRHMAENTDLLTGQYRERAARLSERLRATLERKSFERQAVLDALMEKQGGGDEARVAALTAVEARFAAELREVEAAVIGQLEPEHSKQQLALRQRQLREIVTTTRAAAPGEESWRRLQRLEIERQAAELAEYQRQVEADKEARIAAAEAERRQFEADLKRRHAAE